jgi:3-methyladenine DNA glycosylase Tag
MSDVPCRWAPVEGGPTIVYAGMRAVGLVNDHEVRCPRFRAVRKP